MTAFDRAWDLMKTKRWPESLGTDDPSISWRGDYDKAHENIMQEHDNAPIPSHDGDIERYEEKMRLLRGFEQARDYWRRFDTYGIQLNPGGINPNASNIKDALNISNVEPGRFPADEPEWAKEEAETAEWLENQYFPMPKDEFYETLIKIANDHEEAFRLERDLAIRILDSWREDE